VAGTNAEARSVDADEGVECDLQVARGETDGVEEMPPHKGGDQRTVFEGAMVLQF